MDRKSVNKHGTQLIEFCKTTGILILNGRISHDRGIGCFTRDDKTGRSVVDYAIARPMTLKSVSYFNVTGSCVSVYADEDTHRRMGSRFSFMYMLHIRTLKDKQTQILKSIH